MFTVQFPAQEGMGASLSGTLPVRCGEEKLVLYQGAVPDLHLSLVTDLSLNSQIAPYT